MNRLPEIVFLLILAAVVAGFFLGRRKGKLRLQASLSAADASGYARAETALAAQLSQVVNVNAGNTGLPSAFSAEEEEGIRQLLSTLRMGLDRDLERARHAAAIGARPNHHGGSGDNDHGSVLGHVEHLQLSGGSDSRVFGFAERDRHAADRGAHPSNVGTGPA